MPEAALQYFKYRYDNTPSVNQENKDPGFSVVWGRDWRHEAFTQSDLVSTRDDQAQELIRQVRQSAFIANRESLANQLVTLFKYAKEERPFSPGISADSLRNFYDFIVLNENLRIPSLSLSPDHNVYASWRAKNRLFSAHFLSSGEIRFVLFKPNNRHPNRRIRITGTSTGDMLTKIIAPENLSGWVLGEGRYDT